MIKPHISAFNILTEWSQFKVGVDDAEGPPVPIPNTEVKLSGAENSALATRCENREMPILAASFPLSVEADFYSRLFLFCELLISNPPFIANRFSR